MKKSISVLIYTFMIIFLLTGCKDNGSVQSSAPARTNQIYKLEIISAVENDEHIYHVNYPDYYYAFDKESMSCVSLKMPDMTAKDAILPEDYIYITEYVENIPENENVSGGNLAFSVTLYYYDENGKECHTYVLGYDELPEGWNEFIDCVNHICGDDYLSAEGEIVEVTPEFLQRAVGVSENDIIVGNLEDLIRTNSLTIKEVTYHAFDMNEEIKEYFRTVKEPIVKPFRPTSLDMVDSTPEEYDRFVESFLAELGGDWEEIESEYEYLRYFQSINEQQCFYIGRSADLANLSVNDKREYYNIEFDIHVEGMVCSSDYFYNLDRKYIIVNDVSGASNVEDSDVLFKFIGLGTDAQMPEIIGLDELDLTQYNTDLDELVRVTQEQLDSDIAVNELQLPDYMTLAEYAYYDLEPDGDEDLIVQYDISEFYPHHVPYGNALVYGHRVIAIFTNQGDGTWKCVGRNGAMMPEAVAFNSYATAKLENGKLIIYQKQIGYDNYFKATYHFTGEGFVLEEIRYFITDGKYEDAITYCRIYNYAEQLVCQYTYENKDIDNITSYDWIGSISEEEITLENSVRIWQQVECDTECTLYENPEAYVQDGTFAELIAE